MIESFQQVLLRTPLQSLKNAYEFSNGLSELFEEGIYLSSPEFYEELKKTGDISKREKSKVHLSLSKYCIRSASRCTPYGTFAGCALVNVTDDETSIILGQMNEHVRHIRIDMNYVTEIINALLKLPPIKEQIKVYPNNSIYELSASYRYVEYTIENNLRSYSLNSIRKSKYIKAVLKFASTGAKIKSLVDLLVVSEKVEENEAVDFISDMYKSQLLVSELEPNITGEEPLDRLIAQLELFKGIQHIISTFKSIQKIIRQPKAGIECYKEIENYLRKLRLPIQIPKNTLQTDLFVSLKKNNIDAKILKEIGLQIQDLLIFSGPQKNAFLETFKNNFINKYDREEIELSIALDADIGIGYAEINQSTSGGNKLIDDLLITGKDNLVSSQIDHKQQFILSKYLQFLENNDAEIELTKDELLKFKSKQTKVYRQPRTLYLMGSLLKKDSLLSTEKFKFDILGIAAQSPAKLLARFSHGDPQLCALTKNILKEEEKEYPEAIFAEFVHLPQARISNILLRPILGDYEIPYVGGSGIDKKSQIPINDIMISVRNNEIILRSKNHNKRIIPRLTTAHNYSQMSLPIYRFLGDLQYQGKTNINFWDWDTLSAIKHLPKVIYKNLVIKKARWKVDLDDISDMPENKSYHLDYFSVFRSKIHIPKKVTYVESDNKLLIDFENTIGIELFLHYLHRHKSIVIEEFLYTEENCIINDVNNLPFINELIVPFKLSNNLNGPGFQNQISKNIAKRKFIPSSEWLYFKIYCGPATAEIILKENILTFINKHEVKAFKKFFFIRFSDQSNHIRIRFLNVDSNKQSALQIKFIAIFQKLVADNVVEKIVLDTYSRELERYGPDLINESESIFYNDSVAVLKFISLLEDESSEQYRMLFALRGIDMLLDDFQLTLVNKAALLKQMFLSYFKEFGESPQLQKQLNEKYRQNQKMIFSHMDEANDIINEIEEAVSVFQNRSKMNKPVIENIKFKLNGADLKLYDLLGSYLHMFMNRLFINNQRKCELVIYLFLERYYTSQNSITKLKNTPKQQMHH
ncbi:lantibiotic dehydratase [Mucilaginibacter sp.]|uniref:lantibiotic dehydratase n=1 Tax=Mucilaginibacter sp. TaxID=1882438 RepID=UPI002625B6EB|nr:lantibiotic dehydratase [Mucilaginibacter sp.]MDB4926552.1 hypothetical protein [Mucilaginibacter sp.]